MKNKKSETGSFFEYKGKPLVRCGNVIYYGDINDRFVVKIESLETKKMDDLEISSRLSVEMIDMESETMNTKKIAKISEKNGLYLALDIASIWLERAA